MYFICLTILISIWLGKMYNGIAVLLVHDNSKESTSFLFALY